MRRVKKTDLKAAIKDSAGIILTVARRLGVSWATARKYINKWPDTIALFQDESEKMLDLSEETIFQSIKDGDTQDAKWLLSRKGKARGYADNIDVTSGGKPLVVVDWDATDTDQD